MARTKRVEPEPRALSPFPAGTRAILRQGPEAVAYHIPVSPSTDDGTPLKSTIALPRHSAWTSGLHFHATHTEYLRLIKGAIFVELNNKMKFISALVGGEVDGTGQLVQSGLIIEVPRYAFHNWGRLEHHNDSARSPGRRAQHEDILPEDWTEEVIVEEWTDPSDIAKPLFFWNLNGIITAPGEAILPKRQSLAKGLLGSLWVDLQLFLVFWELDNWPVFNVFRTISPASDSHLCTLRVLDATKMLVSFGALLLAKLFGTLLGLKAVEKRRTPDALWEAYKKSQYGHSSRY
ncbi:hypothetical protein E8E12_009826 [Didymella heteroderae]|uniref:Uncharacterized protein n=1 Tax=Didymella heteroderae TaxID=1769908 RepID=A0A9P4WWW8_9PLEO|nr:hypothetical protein E8E12_009826 [Didymella heteroderae]